MVFTSSPAFCHGPKGLHAVTRQERGPLLLECRYAKGKLAAKTERLPGPQGAPGRLVTHEYAYDAGGRLAQARRNGIVTERYAYDAMGRRVLRQGGEGCSADGNGHPPAMRVQSRGAHAAPPAAEPFAPGETCAYDAANRLLRAGNVLFGWDGGGSLAWRYDERGFTYFDYRGGPFLHGALLPDGTRLGYEYGPDGLPLRRWKNGALTTVYLWGRNGRLRACTDREQGPLFLLEYGNGAGENHLERIVVGWFNGSGLEHAVLSCGCDQVGTPRVLTDPGGALIKELAYDNFGNLIFDGNPRLRLPVGFAGGLPDPDTSLVRFGYRDYDPRAGRFTAADPARDLRGDGDLYDYCVDDPVSKRDPWGLAWTKATFDESKVNRDAEGKFAEKAGGSQNAESSLRRSAEHFINESRRRSPESETPPRNAQGGFGPLDDDYGNDFRHELGPYKGATNHGFWNDHPVILEKNVEDSGPSGQFIHDAFIPDRGILGAWGSKSHKRGELRIVVYGDPATGKPSSWQIYEWGETGKKEKGTGRPLYGWLLVPNVRAAQRKPGFYKAIQTYRNIQVNR